MADKQVQFVPTDSFILRQMGKQRLTLSAVRAALAMLLCAFACLGPMATAGFAANGRLSSDFVTDPLTGVALEGYDAVSYFTEAAPVPGRPEYEHYWAGVPWYFATEANRDAFAQAPSAYAPVFGGYGAMSVARGFLSAGNPRIYAILGNRLFLFYSTGNRAAFLVAPRAAYKKAAANWENLSQNLP